MWAIAAGTFTLGGLLYLGMKIFAPWIQDDLVYIRGVLRMKTKFDSRDKKKQYLADIFDESVSTSPDKTFIIFKDKKYTYRQVNEKANQVAHAAMEMGLSQGDLVALLMFNEPAYVWIYLGKYYINISFLLTEYENLSS